VDLSYRITIIIIIIIIIINHLYARYMQPETNNASKAYSVAAILHLQFRVHVHNVISHAECFVLLHS
jgi:hypothetical protein